MPIFLNHVDKTVVRENGTEIANAAKVYKAIMENKEPEMNIADVILDD